jgi:hypothetical protein
MDAILFYGIIILLALGFLAFAWMVIKGWLEMILWFLASVARFLWSLVKMVVWVVTLPVKLLIALWKLVFRGKAKEKGDVEA